MQQISNPFAYSQMVVCLSNLFEASLRFS